MGGGIQGVFCRRIRTGLKGAPNDEGLKDMAAQLGEKGYIPAEVDDAMERISRISKGPWFPSLGEILQALPKKMNPLDEKRALEQKNLQAKGRSYQEEAERKREKFSNYYSKEVLEKFIDKYMAAAGVSPMMRGICWPLAINHLSDANGDFSQAIERGKISAVKAS